MSYSSFDIEPASQRSSKQARDRLNALAKPPGSLGRLEEVAVRLAGMQRRCPPRAGRVRVVVFAASHGVASHHRVSAYPSEVTASMVGAFCRGQAAVNVLAERSHIPVEVVDVGVEAIVSSDLQRAVQTAEILEDQLGRPRHETRLLREMHFGDWEMSTWASIEHREPEAYQAFMEDWIHTAAPGGESFRDLCTRVEHFWAEHAPGLPAEVALVAHRGTCSALAGHLLGWEPAEAFRRGLDYAAACRIDVSHASWEWNIGAP